MMKPGKTNQEVTQAIAKVAEAFHCQPVEGVLSHKMTRFVLDGTKVISNRDDPDHQVENQVFEEGEVYWSPFISCKLLHLSARILASTKSSL